jgi:hypothetical protein
MHFLHAVDFGYHGRGGIEGMYYRPKSEARGRSLNLLRKSEMESILNAAKFTCACIVYRKTEVGMMNIHSSWKKYRKEDLGSSVVLFVGGK